MESLRVEEVRQNIGIPLPQAMFSGYEQTSLDQPEGHDLLLCSSTSSASVERKDTGRVTQTTPSPRLHSLAGTNLCYSIIEQRTGNLTFTGVSQDHTHGKH